MRTSIKKEKLKEFRKNHEKLGFLEAEGKIYIKHQQGQLIAVTSNGFMYVVDNATNRNINPNKYHLKGLEEYIEHV